jgi:hypothetical protein
VVAPTVTADWLAEVVEEVSDTQPTEDPAAVVVLSSNCVALKLSGVPSASALVIKTSEEACCPPFVVALATGAETTVNIPAVRADAATNAIRCLIVFVDIYFLSLVSLRIS